MYMLLFCSFLTKLFSSIIKAKEETMLKTLFANEFAKELMALSTLFSAAYMWLVMGTAVVG